jgi:ParB/Sulfiredoxin domain
MPGPTKRDLEFHYLDNIQVHNRKRELDQAEVARLAESMKTIGLRTPITLRYYEEWPDHLPPRATPSDALVLLTGARRLAAAQLLGWEKIECFVYLDGDEIDAELWEIAENLHRGELTALERDEQVARWVHLIKKRKVSQTETPLPGGPQPSSKGVRAAERELGIDKSDASRALSVAALAPDAKRVARETGLDKNRGVLLGAAKEKTPEAQIHYLHAEARKRQEDRRKPPNNGDDGEIEYSALAKAWLTASLASQERFLAEFGLCRADGATGAQVEARN